MEQGRGLYVSYFAAKPKGYAMEEGESPWRLQARIVYSIEEFDEIADRDDCWMKGDSFIRFWNKQRAKVVEYFTKLSEEEKASLDWLRDEDDEAS